MVKKILVLIDQSSIGGAEYIVKETSMFNTAYKFDIVVLKPFKSQFLNASNYNLASLNINNIISLIKGIKKYRQILNNHQYVLIHTHLFYSTLFARILTPRKIPIVTTLHSVYSLDVYKKKLAYLILENITCNRTNYLLAVSNFVLTDYTRKTFYRGHKFVLYNYIQSEYYPFKNPKSVFPKKLKIISVGNIKKVKNYQFSIEALSYLYHCDISLDIYGNGNLDYASLSLIQNKKLKINIFGSIELSPDIYCKYDIFLQSSFYEGYGKALVEAISCGLFPILSDIPVHREITSNKAIYFSLNDVSELVSIFRYIYAHGQTAYDTKLILNKTQSISSYISNLNSIYSSINK